jgi:ABC-type multidrug transport system permease subunit
MSFGDIGVSSSLRDVAERTVYYLDPFKYLLGALMTFTIWDAEVECKDSEYGVFDPPTGMTCGEYMSGFLAQATGYLRDPVSAGPSRPSPAHCRRRPTTVSTAGTETAANTSTT